MAMAAAAGITICSSESQRLELLAFVNGAMEERLSAMFPPEATELLNSLNRPDGPIVSIKIRLDQLEHNLAQAMPELTGSTLKMQQAQVEMEEKHQKSIEEIGKRDTEVSEKLRLAFNSVEAQLAEATGRIKEVQSELVEVGNKQRAEIAEAKLAVG